ncbi:hypothetical protein SEEE3944_17100 [Salmonella enterica subsp. enterica serovar Enteritidis str. 33944]|nr:hypothetical protein SEEE3944_17100 [Salmonella enterica subsp. enterica serovar Enteritidis str. 33944]ESC52027.1 hypothetical protein SEENP078_06117 [Salmonella enterica subsp. enterica serovar Newport str. RI_10P078]KJU55847.1 hypothetical protein CFSAN00323_08086 [Salmonella enterica subsp. enterica serovar Heidelberg str. CFSAN00323]
MQVLNSLRNAKQRHPDCQIVKRKGRLYVICKTNPRFKAVQGRKKDVKKPTVQGKQCVPGRVRTFLLPAGFCAGQRKNIVEGKFALTGNHFLQLDFMFIIHLWRLKNRLNERGGNKAGVVPFAVVTDPEVQHIDVVIVITRGDVEKEEAIKCDK